MTFDSKRKSLAGTRAESEKSCRAEKFSRAAKRAFPRILFFAGTALLLAWALYAFPPEATRPYTFGTPSRVAKFVFSALWIAVFFARISTMRLGLRATLLAAVFLPSAVAFFIEIYYGVAPFSWGFLCDVAQTNRREALAFVGVPAVLALVGFVAGTLLFSLLLGKFRPTGTRGKIFRFGVPAALVLLACLSSKNVLPIYYYRRPLKDLRRICAVDLKILGEISSREKLPPKILRADALPRERIVALHVGESTRSDHATMNGYARDTFPRMMRERERGNLFCFGKTVSYAVTTRLSVLGMMTPATIADPVIRAQSFIPALNACGVETRGFMSGAEAGGDGEYDTSMNAVCAALNAWEKTPELAHALLPKIRSFIEGGNADARGNANRFFVYQGEGAHAAYEGYDAEKFSVFVPADFRVAKKQSTINAYDNCLVCTDDFIGNVIDALRDKTAVYVYCSDHGEFLGDDGLWTRGNGYFMEKPPMRYVLFFIWVSDKFKEAFPQKFAALKANAERLGVVSHDHVYHTILGAHGIETEDYDASLDLFSPQAKPFAGTLPEDLPAGTVFDSVLLPDESLRLSF